jgi:hypothetical protein
MGGAVFGYSTSGGSGGSGVFIIAIQLPSIGLPPSITSITYSGINLVVNFSASTGGTTPPSSYSYSLNGGAYVNANTTTSPIVIRGLNPGSNYSVSLIATNIAGDTISSNIVFATVPYPCFLEGTRILALNKDTQEAEYIPVELLRKGDLVKTYARGFVPIHVIGNAILKNPKDDHKKDNRLYRFTPDAYPELEEDLCITGNHCILWQRISAKKRQQVEEHMGKVFITEGKYRVPAFLDDKSVPYTEEGPCKIWHFALENDNRYDNYGVLANGLLVESSSIRYMTELSNMELVCEEIRRT